MTRYLNLLWLAAILGFTAAGWVPGLLGVLCVFVMDVGLEVKRVRACVETIAAVFSTEPETLTEERAEQMTESVMERLRDEMKASAQRRPH